MKERPRPINYQFFVWVMTVECVFFNPFPAGVSHIWDAVFRPISGTCRDFGMTLKKRGVPDMGHAAIFQGFF